MPTISDQAKPAVRHAFTALNIGHLCDLHRDFLQAHDIGGHQYWAAPLNAIRDFLLGHGVPRGAKVVVENMIYWLPLHSAEIDFEETLFTIDTPF